MALLNRSRAAVHAPPYSFTHPPLQGVLSPRELGRVGALLLGSAGLLGAIGMAILVVAGPGAQGPGFHPVVVGSMCVATFLGSVLVVWRSANFYSSWAAVAMALAIGVVTLVAFYAGPRASPFATLFFLWVGTAFVLLPPGIAALEVLLAAALDGILLTVQPGHRAPFAAWQFTVGVTALTAWIIKRVVDALMATAGNERVARTEAERANAQLERVNQRETEFLTRTSHEVRTPLNVIIGFADMLGDGMVGDLNPHQAEYVAEVQTSGRHLLELIGDVLDVAKVEAGREDLDVVEFDLDRVLAPAVGLFRPEAERQGIRLDLVAGATPIVVRGDERKVRQVLLNLLGNAVKFTPSGGSVTVSSSVRAGVLSIEVADTGPGIAGDDLERIFEEYRQAPAGAASSGTGLGLPLARRFTEQHDGTLEVASRPGVGSVFTVRLPLSGPLARRPAAAAPVQTADQPPPGPWQPLDNPDLRARMAHLPVVLGLGGVVLGAITVCVNLVEPARGFRTVPLVVIAAAATLVAVTAGRRTSVLTTAGMSGLLVSAVIAFTLCDYFVGVDRQPYGAMLFVWIGIAAVSFVPRRWSVALVAFVAACYAGLLVVQHGNAAPLARWLVVVGIVSVSALSVSTLLDRLAALAEAERRARIRLEAIHAELEAASHHKTQFLATMSHELRTPLNAIIGFSDVLQDELFGPLTEKQREYARDLSEAGHQLLALVNDILDLAKADAGRMELDLTEEVDITDALMLAGNARRPVAVDVVAGALRKLDVDEHKFRRVLDNLIDEVADIAKVERVVVSASTSADALTVDVNAMSVGRPESGGVPLRIAVASALAELHGGRVETTVAGWRLILPLRALSRESV